MQTQQRGERLEGSRAVACSLPQDGVHETLRFHGIMSGGMATAEGSPGGASIDVLMTRHGLSVILTATSAYLYLSFSV